MQETNEFYGLLLRGLFEGYGVFTIVGFIILLFIKEISFLNQLNEVARRFIVFIGEIYIIFLAVELLIVFFNNKQSDILYWSDSWIYPISWIICSQLLRSKKIADRKIIRLVMSFVFLSQTITYLVTIDAQNTDYSTGAKLFYTTVQLVTMLAFFLFALAVYTIVVKTWKQTKHNSDSSKL